MWDLGWRQRFENRSDVGVNESQEENQVAPEGSCNTKKEEGWGLPSWENKYLRG